MQNVHIGIESASLENIHKFSEKIKEKRFNEKIDWYDRYKFYEPKNCRNNELLGSLHHKGNFKEFTEFLSSFDEKFANLNFYK